MASHAYQNPADYSKNNSLQFDFAMRIISRMNVNKAATILDVGCGDGLITSQLARLAPNGHVLGTDISEKMIEFAKNKYSHLNNLNFEVMDATKNKFHNQFNLITSFNALHWVKDQQAALDGIANAALKDADIILLLSHKKSLYHFVFDVIIKSDKWAKYFTDYVNPRSFFEVDNYKNMLEKSNLTVTSITEEEMIYHFENRESLKNFYRASSSYLKKIPEDESEKFLDDVCDEYLFRLNHSQKTIPVCFWCLGVLARK